MHASVGGGGFQGCSRDEHRHNWRCARAVRKRPPPPPTYFCQLGSQSGSHLASKALNTPSPSVKNPPQPPHPLSVLHARTPACESYAARQPHPNTRAVHSLQRPAPCRSPARFRAAVHDSTLHRIMHKPSTTPQHIWALRTVLLRLTGVAASPANHYCCTVKGGCRL